MALWDKISTTGRVEDRRGSPMAIGGGLGIVGLGIVLLLNILGGGNVGDVLNQLQDVQLDPQTNYNAKDFEGVDSYELFTSKVLGSANDLWRGVFQKNNLTYTEPTLVLFRTATNSACGGADSRVGPHYCPYDETIYLDETFFNEINKRFGAQGGDVAEAYVIAHEVGHHVQNELYGIKADITNEESVAQELQADCLAGLWAYSLKDLGIFESGEITEAINEAAAVGDDRIQMKTEGRVNPETWTHGSSAERVASFTKGYESGLVSSCGL
jgi:predicted metalloprotease